MEIRALLPFTLALLWMCIAVQPAQANREANRLYERAVSEHGQVSVSEQFTLYARAAEAGHPVAQYNVAMMDANGEAVNVDYQQAAYWFLKSANQRFAPAQHRLGELHYFGMGGLTANPRTAARWFEAAASQADPDGCMNLAIMVGSGDVVPLDSGRAVELLDCADDGAHESAVEYRQLLQASPNGRYSEAQRRSFWSRQRQYWVDMAAQFGVRDAEEAVTDGNPVP